jgi:DNA-binding winged helix-turn-helix (wHTH) protein
MIYTFGDCELDLQACELRRAGEHRHLEPQVFDLLSYLLQHRERLVRKDELLDTIWGHRFVAPATLNSRVKAARQAVGDDGTGQHVIRTIRGRGFRFVAPVTMRESSQGKLRLPGSVFVPARRPGPDPPAPPVGMGQSAPELIARASELRFLLAALESACSGTRQLAFITGEPGIGKTTLAEAFLARIPQGVRITRGQCMEQRGAVEPYLPIIDALGRLCRRSDGADLVAHFEASAPTWLAQMPSLLWP